MKSYSPILAAAILMGNCLAPSIGLSQDKTQTFVDSNTIVVDLDQPVKYIYKEKALAKCGIGSKPGAFIIKRTTHNDIRPGPIAIDEQLNLYINDPGNHRIQEFDRQEKFIKVFAQYPNDFDSFNLVVDQKHHLFLSGYHEILEIADSRIVNRLPSQNAISILSDGNAWFFDANTTSYRSLDGKDSVFIGPSTSTIVWPWCNGKITTIKQDSSATEISIDNHRVFVKGKNVSIEPLRVTREKIFFKALANEKSYVIELKIAGFAVKVISIPDAHKFIGFSFAPNGSFYGTDAGERGEIGSGEFFCEIVAGIQEKAP